MTNAESTSSNNSELKLNFGFKEHNQCQGLEDLLQTGLINSVSKNKNKKTKPLCLPACFH